MLTEQKEKPWVDAVGLRKILEEEKTCCERSDKLIMGLEIAIADLGDMESFNAVSVVFCKDCKYWRDYRQYGKDDGWCVHLGVDRDAAIATTTSYNYCSHGLRREEDND